MRLVHTWGPRLRLFDVAKGTLRYCIGSKQSGTKFGGFIPNCVNVFCDADFAADKSRRSRSRFVLIFACSAIQWGSKLQLTIALSTMEAEFT
jgi:hypothetical protein